MPTQPTTNQPQFLGFGPKPQFPVTPPFTFLSNPPEYPTIPPVAHLGIGPFNVNPNAGVPV